MSTEGQGVGKLARVAAEGPPATQPEPTGWPPTERILREVSLSSAATIYVDVTVRKLPLRAVVDTAGQVTVLSAEVWKQIAAGQGHTEPVSLRGAAVNSRMPAHLVRQIHLSVGNQEYNWDCYVAPISDDMILGLDFLSAQHAIIDLPQSKLLLLDNPVAIQILSAHVPDTQVSRYFLRRSVVVPPHSVLQTPLSGQPFQGATSLMVTALDVDASPGVQVVAGLTRNEEIVPILLANSSSRHIRVTPESLDIQAEGLGTIPCVREIADPSSLSVDDPVKDFPEHLTALVDRSISDLDCQEVSLLTHLLSSFGDVFASSDTDLGRFEGITHRIDTGTTNPIKQRMRRTPLGFADEEDRHLQSMLDNGIIRPSFSDWASPPVLVRKRDGSVRYCVDFRKLNDVTKKDVFPLPLIEECVDALGGSRFFSTLDMCSGYWQLEIEEADKPKTAFVTKRGLYEHNRMAFGLCNAPATFQRAMQVVLEGLTWDSVLVYLDDVIVLGQTFEEHLDNLRQVFERFRTFHLKLKPRKCLLFQARVPFLGRMVSRDGIEMDPEKVKKVEEWPLPHSAKEVASFLGLVNYHREHISHYAGLAAPLYALMKTDSEFEWTEEHTGAFETLKRAMVAGAVLAYPLPEGQFILDTDASNTAIGAELSQEQGGEIRVVAYGSFVLNPAQQNYCTTRKELLAVVRFTRVFRHYLLGRPFLLRTDHGCLTWLMRFKQINGQLARWIEELSQYDMTILHRQGSKHANADALSRIPDHLQSCHCYVAGSKVEDLPCGGCAYCRRAHDQWATFEEEVDDVVPLAIRSVKVETELHPSREQPNGIGVRSIQLDVGSGFRDLSKLRQEQRADADIGPVLGWLEQDEVPKSAVLALRSRITKELWHQRKLLCIQEGVLFHKKVMPHLEAVTNAENFRLRLVVPRALVPEVLHTCHSVPLAGHPGGDRLIEKLGVSFYWPGMSADSRLFVASCPECNRSKHSVVKPRAPLGSFHAGEVMERVHIDILGPFPVSSRGNKYVLMVIDQFTKWVECFPLGDQVTETVAEALLEGFFVRFGCPMEVHSDQGSNFQSGLFNALCQSLQIAKTRTTPYRPCSNGQIERMNRTLLQMVRCFIGGNQSEWDRHIPQLAGAMRASVNRSTGFTANMLMLGREVRLPTDLQFSPPLGSSPAVAPYLSHFLDRSRRVHEAARVRLQATQLYQKKQYDRRTQISTYAAGDVVYILEHGLQKEMARKLRPIWKGPLLVMEALSPLLFRVRGPRRATIVHHDLLKPYHEEVLPLWTRRARHQLLHPDEPFCSEDRSAEEDTGDEPLADIRHLFPESVKEALAPSRSGRSRRLPVRFQ